MVVVHILLDDLLDHIFFQQEPGTLLPLIVDGGEDGQFPVFQDFCNSLYWLTEKPEKPTWEDVKKAKFGFPVVGFKASAVSAGFRNGIFKNKTVPNGAFHIMGEFAEIEGVPNMREDMGLLYRLNKLLTVFYPITLGISILLGWLRTMTPIISGLYALISLTVAVMSFFTSVQNNLDEYGVPLVILRQSKNKRIDSIIFDLAIAAFPLYAAYAHIMMMVGIILN